MLSPAPPPPCSNNDVYTSSSAAAYEKFAPAANRFKRYGRRNASPFSNTRCVIIIIIIHTRQRCRLRQWRAVRRRCSETMLLYVRRGVGVDGFHDVIGDAIGLEGQKYVSPISRDSTTKSAHPSRLASCADSENAVYRTIRCETESETPDLESNRSRAF